MFGKTKCLITDNNCWVYHKYLYSDKFLDQKVKIEVENERIFTNKERDYLHNLLEPFKDKVIEIKLVKLINFELVYLQVIVKSVIFPYNGDNIRLPCFETGTMYKNLEVNKSYRNDELKELLTELKLL